VAFDFPRDAAHVRDEMAAAGLKVEQLVEGAVVFRYGSSEAVLDHLLKSGAGTAFYDALDPARREGLRREFIRLLAGRHRHSARVEVVHDYILCLARKPSFPRSKHSRRQVHRRLP
jgi:hypothetical protein